MARKPKAPINMSSLLKSTTGTLAQIQEKTNSLTILANIVRHICPDLPADAWHIANSRDDILIVDVKSPAWGQRLQFERNNICNALIEQTHGQFQRIEIKINPQSFRQSRTNLFDKKPQNTISQTSKSSDENNINTVNNAITAQQFLEVAKKAPKGLKEKLEKLAKVAGNKHI
ncbi:DUF721 domain-containing protein [Colwellia sp. D2M02]|uniref:DUF721 domain-containing protein n=1 Tax=Colwellia sp. D2M02 TaxID=2841562 RepID=UPI001C0A4298|nr:DciA family protein [Colwellia sp. D2M02]MBU2894830.1 DUF721 domain-containing protein [Colwellia sp. D2M02]